MMFDKNGNYKNGMNAAKEVQFVYEGEANEGDAASGAGADQSDRVNLVEVPKKRPSWFENNLKSKVSTSKVSEN